MCIFNIKTYVYLELKYFVIDHRRVGLWGRTLTGLWGSLVHGSCGQLSGQAVNEANRGSEHWRCSGEVIWLEMTPAQYL